MPSLAAFIREDVSTVMERDPAAKSRLEVYLCYSGLHAVWFYRINHWLWNHGFLLLARWLLQVARFHFGARPVDSRTTSVGSIAISEACSPLCSIIAITVSAAIYPILPRGCRTLVRLVCGIRPQRISSKPATEISCGFGNLLPGCDLIPMEIQRKALRKIFDFNVMKFAKGEMGAVNGMAADGTIIKTGPGPPSVSPPSCWPTDPRRRAIARPGACTTSSTRPVCAAHII